MSKKDKILALSKFTSTMCNQCPVPEAEKERHKKYRCCNRIFCEIVKAQLPPGVSYEFKENEEVPYWNNGCVVSPEHRPMCTGFLCQGWRSSKHVWRTYEKLCKKAGIPQNKAPLIKPKKP